MCDKLIKALEEAAEANAKLVDVYEATMAEAAQSKNISVYEYYKQLRYELVDALETIDNELHKLKE